VYQSVGDYLEGDVTGPENLRQAEEEGIVEEELPPGEVEPDRGYQAARLTLEACVVGRHDRDPGGRGVGAVTGADSGPDPYEPPRRVPYGREVKAGIEKIKQHIDFSCPGRIMTSTNQGMNKDSPEEGGYDASNA
jgi:hypothetical protein